MMNTETTAPKQGEAPSGTAPKKRGHGPGRPFEKGKSGNPNGRPKGSLTRRSREIAERVMSTDDLTPLEILLAGMKVAYEAGDWDNVHKFASAAAPYCHSKLQAIEHYDTPRGVLILANNGLFRYDGSRIVRRSRSLPVWRFTPRTRERVLPQSRNC